MGGTSTSVLLFVRADPVVNTLNKSADDPQSNMEIGTLKVEPISSTKLPLSDIQKEFSGNMSCIVKARAGDTHTGLPCFRHIVTMLRLLSREDIKKMTVTYLRNGHSEVARQTMIDALGGAHTSDCYSAMMQHVFHAKHPEAELLMRALFQLVDLSAPTPEVVFATLEYVVFNRTYTFEDEEVTQQVNDRATLVLATVAKKVQHSRSEWASSVVLRLEQRIGVHDPYHHRQLRSTMTEKEESNYLNWKTLHIHALGNAARDSSLGYLESYLNDSTINIALRSSAVDAIAKYKHKYIADVLLSVALTDQEENVRLAAVNGYKTHPHGGDIRALLDPVYARSHNTTQVEHSRMKRSLSNSRSRIWKGFKFHKESPSVNWVEHTGGSKLGASIGVIIKNSLDIQIMPLLSKAKIDVLDTAWAEVHVGIFGLNYDIFRAELCFKGGIEYELNILKEYDYDQIQKFAELYDTVVNTVVTTIKDAVKSFKNLVSTFKNTDFSDIIDNLIESVKQLPRKVFNLRRIGKRIYKAIGKFVELPPVVTQVKGLITKVTTLFSDIKTDIMNLYDAIADSINTVVPWAWREIKRAFNGITKAIKKLLKNPQSAIQEIGEGIARLSAAVAGVIDAKHKIEEANFFTKENRPYWFDIKTVLKDIWLRVRGIKKSLTDTVTWLKSGSSANDIAERFTGVSLTKMKTLALEEIKKVLEEELEEPLRLLKQLLEPFQQAYDFFIQTVKNVKEAWRVIRNGYQTARTLLEEIFGPKMHEDWPRKLLESSSCGDGFWESDGKGHYGNKGIMLEVTVGQPIVAPYGGQLKKTGPREVTITVNEMNSVKATISNVDLNVDEKEVAAGEILGQGITPSWCRDPHVHVALVKIDKGTVIDPTGYLRKRKMPPPHWVQECDHYTLRWLGETISQGKILGEPDQGDTTPPIDGTTEDLNVDVMEDTDRKKRGTSELIDQINDFAKSLGLPDLTKLKDVFNFNMNSITLNTILGYLDQVGLSTMKTKIINILKEIEKRTNHQSCINPETMDVAGLKQALVTRGQATSGARQTLINRYLSSDPQCFDIGSRVGPNVYCRFDKSCTSVSCCVDLKLFIYRHTLTAFVRYDPCDVELTIGVNTWTGSFKVFEHDFSEFATGVACDTSYL
ncbi:hypothetical protein NP493_1383g00012 [Ridgeia piscesae]|uniref:Vitellogenin domain-containing protein n=1 Tax=Ridgeia piscesae TaxID=27915 RepID=A0AAD9K5F4_RIDPI|nr:hypothetical protein NP493_1383g00012 [Ridgeia piscesae]